MHLFSVDRRAVDRPGKAFPDMIQAAILDMEGERNRETAVMPPDKPGLQLAANNGHGRRDSLLNLRCIAHREPLFPGGRLVENPVCWANVLNW